MKWIEGKPPLHHLKEKELILIVETVAGMTDTSLARYENGSLNDTFNCEPFEGSCIVKWARIEDESDKCEAGTNPEQRARYYFISYFKNGMMHNTLTDISPLFWQEIEPYKAMVNWKEISEEDFNEHVGTDKLNGS